jgi:hypothetical protein
LSSTSYLSIRASLIGGGLPEALVDELLEAFAEAKRRYYRSDLRPQAVEGGRFSEAAFRILQWATTGTYTQLGKALPRVDDLLVALSNASGDEGVRLHIPRTLRLIYDIRNKRDAAHLGRDIDPNIQDATLIVRNMDWVLAEFVRLYNGVTADEAQGIIIDLVSKDVPVIQEFNGYPRVLKDLRASDHCLVLLYRAGTEGIPMDQLSDWVRPTMRKHLKRTIGQLVARNLVHTDAKTVYITWVGEQTVEQKRLLEPA